MATATDREIMSMVNYIRWLTKLPERYRKLQRPLVMTLMLCYFLSILTVLYVFLRMFVAPGIEQLLGALIETIHKAVFKLDLFAIAILIVNIIGLPILIDTLGRALRERK